MKCEDCGGKVKSDCWCAYKRYAGWEKKVVEYIGAEDNVNNPSHYNQSGIECIEAIKASLGDGYQDYCKGNVMKYLWRYKHKNGLEDLKKAQWYLNSMVESVAFEESVEESVEKNNG